MIWRAEGPIGRDHGSPPACRQEHHGSRHHEARTFPERKPDRFSASGRNILMVAYTFLKSRQLVGAHRGTVGFAARCPRQAVVERPALPLNPKFADGRRELGIGLLENLMQFLRR
jgi:hypothetical protein